MTRHRTIHETLALPRKRPFVFLGSLEPPGVFHDPGGLQALEDHAIPWAEARQTPRGTSIGGLPKVGPGGLRIATVD